MDRPCLELADIFREFGDLFRREYGKSMCYDQFRVIRAVEVCRTAELGGHVDQCDHCEHQVISYNSCRNRHCPKCQSLATDEWLKARSADILPVDYYHIVFTVPDAIAKIMLQNKKVMFSILFRAVSETLRTVAADPKHLGAEIGFMAILHTWGQNLMFHPHIHCVVPGGGLSDNKENWVHCNDGFFLPIRVLSRLFRGKFLSLMRKAVDQGKIQFHGSLEHLKDPEHFNRILNVCYRMEWVVYSKSPFGGPEKVLEYLARYTYKIAISNHRLLKLEGDQVSFHYRDYSNGNRLRIMTLYVLEFIRRFLMHVLPPGFTRIRYYGFLGNRYRAQKLQLCRELLNANPPEKKHSTQSLDWKDCYEKVTGLPVDLCPFCQKGHMVTIRLLRPSSFRKSRSPPSKGGL